LGAFLSALRTKTRPNSGRLGRTAQTGSSRIPKCRWSGGTSPPGGVPWDVMIRVALTDLAIPGRGLVPRLPPGVVRHGGRSVAWRLGERMARPARPSASRTPRGPAVRSGVARASAASRRSDARIRSRPWDHPRHRCPPRLGRAGSADAARRGADRVAARDRAGRPDGHRAPVAAGRGQRVGHDPPDRGSGGGGRPRAGGFREASLGLSRRTDPL
jgi:hypothetical protein